MVKKARLLGDEAKALYHPLSGPAEEIKRALETGFDLEITEEYDRMLSHSLQDLALFVSYTDCWSSAPSNEQAFGLLGYVEEGGGLLVVHTGISLCGNESLIPLIGGRFTGHPPYQSLEFTIPPGLEEHPIVRGIPGFELEDEPYRFEFDEYEAVPQRKGSTILLHYRHEDRLWPAAWCHTYGQGRVVYFMPGHRAEALRHPQAQAFLRAAAKWAAR